MLKILFACSEVHPLIKTGGLADVSGGLPIALSKLGHQVRLVLPAYRHVMQQITVKNILSRITVPGIVGEIELLECKLPNTQIKVILVNYPAAFDRPGNPYINPEGSPWNDNAERFYLFCRAIQYIAVNKANLNWQPDIMHCNDWQTGLVPALLQSNPIRPATVFSIHNLAYQGLYPHEVFESLGLPTTFWSPTALEFHNQFSFIKGGIVYSHCVNTVSPTYMKEIQTPEFGYGLEGLLKHREFVCSGIINGIDASYWNPATDPLIHKCYDIDNFTTKKRHNKHSLQKAMNLPQNKNTLLIAFIGRLVEQKGIDIIVEYVTKYLNSSVQLMILGSGERKYEAALAKLQKNHPTLLSVHIGYNESLAHLIEAGADVLLMPSRFEPCGLNQMYSMRYGTLPIVNNVGGLVDTVTNTTTITLKNFQATGFILEKLTSMDIAKTIDKALEFYKKPRTWNKIIRTAMAQDFSWDSSAKQYVDLYQKALKQKHQRAR